MKIESYTGASAALQPAAAPTMTIRVGETALAQVAERLGVTAESLRLANPRVNMDQLQPGQSIEVPGENSKALALKSNAVTPEFETTSPSNLANQRLENDAWALAARATLGGNSGAVSAPGSLAVKHDKDGSSTAATTAKPSVVKAGASSFDGVKLGTNASRQDVVVKRELGSTQGYDDRLQATAVARMFKAEPAVVVQGSNGKWHALETTAGFDAGPVNAANSAPSARAIYGLPSSAGIAAAHQKVDSIRARLNEIASLKNNGTDTKALRDEASDLATELGHAIKTLESLVLGVPESDLNPIRTSTSREPGKININADPAQTGGVHGAVRGQSPEFDVGRVTAFEVNLKMFQSETAASTMFHEVSHLKDNDLAQQWVQTYQQETKRPFVAGPAGREIFSKWMQAQAPKRLSRADAELVINEASDNSSTTEARSNVRTFLLSLQSGASQKTTTDQLAAYAREMAPGGRYANPARGSWVQAELTQELKTAYQQMPKAMQQQFDAAVDAAKKANPNAWVASLNFKK